MLNRLQKHKGQSGFTIIEVMIVLAIAGLILLVVLLAVPALQRNSRNTTIKNDVSAVASGISTFESDNNGTFPQCVAGTGSVTIDSVTCGTPSANAETTKVQASTVVKSQIGGSQPTPSVTGEIDVWLGQTCPTSLGGTGQPSTRSAALFYLIETSGKPKLQCQDT